MLMLLELTLETVLGAILVLIVLNVLIVGLTLETKISRSIVRRRKRSRTDKLQHALLSSLTDVFTPISEISDVPTRMS